MKFTTIPIKYRNSRYYDHFQEIWLHDCVGDQYPNLRRHISYLLNCFDRDNEKNKHNKTMLSFNMYSTSTIYKYITWSTNLWSMRSVILYSFFISSKICSALIIGTIITLIYLIKSRSGTSLSPIDIGFTQVRMQIFITVLCSIIFCLFSKLMKLHKERAGEPQYLVTNNFIYKYHLSLWKIDDVYFKRNLFIHEQV